MDCSLSYPPPHVPGQVLVHLAGLVCHFFHILNAKYDDLALEQHLR